MPSTMLSTMRSGELILRVPAALSRRFRVLAAVLGADAARAFRNRLLLVTCASCFRQEAPQIPPDSRNVRQSCQTSVCLSFWQRTNAGANLVGQSCRIIVDTSFPAALGSGGYGGVRERSPVGRRGRRPRPETTVTVQTASAQFGGLSGVARWFSRRLGRQPCCARAVSAAREPAPPQQSHHPSTAARASSMKAHLLSGVMVAATLLSGAAFAQSPTSGTAEAAKPATGGLEEVIVTANRREQNLQDVGTSIAAFSGEQLKDLGVTSAADITAVTPNMELVRSYSGPGFNTQVTIRGIGQPDFSDTTEATATTYVDEFYMIGAGQADFLTFDLARVEVARGPQGTVQGRNSTAGSVNYYTNVPALHEYAGQASL